MKTPLRIGSVIFFMSLAFSSVVFAQTESRVKAIDTSAFDQRIHAAEIKLKENPGSVRNKKLLAEAYAKRGLALADAAQYRAALGDFRKSLRLDPKNRKAKRMHDEIIRIYKSINRKPPKWGEEPPPLPVKKSS